MQKCVEMFDRLWSVSSDTTSVVKNGDLLEEFGNVSGARTKLTIISNGKTRKIIGRSTNYLNALAMMFAEEVSIGRRTSCSPDAFTPEWMEVSCMRVFNELHFGNYMFTH
ncbi:MAG: hypothetical protein LBB15_03040 [Puniceicoccales bacterium]|nr:hypothetical protein [Puniceicoccales bacterium]